MTTRIRNFVLAPAATVAGLGLLAAVLLARGPSPVVEGAGPYSVNNSVIRIETVQQGPCQPGALASGNTVGPADYPNSANPIQLRFTAPVNDTPGFRGCIAPRNGPQYLVIDNELFQYANVHTYTLQYVDSTSTNFNLNVENCYGYVPSDLIYVGMERMQWDTGVCDGSGGAQDYLHITSRPDATDYDHGPGSFVRVHGLLLLVGRGGLPKFLDYTLTPTHNIVAPPTSDPIAYTPPVSHSADAPAHSPSTYALCIGRLTQTVVTGGDDPVNARTRCALILEPGYNATTCDSSLAACFWPTSPPADPAVLRRPIFNLFQYWNLLGDEMPPAYDQLTGSLDDYGVGSGSITFSDLPVTATSNCQLFFSLSSRDQLFLSSDMYMTFGIKNFMTGSSGTGTLTTRYFTVVAGAPDPCSGGQYALTIPSTFTYTRLADGDDTDGDGCSDLKELSGTVDSVTGQITGQVTGGWRDPLNHYDYMDAVHSGPPYQVRIPDIVAVVGQYFIDDLPGPIDYASLTDRTALEPASWSLGKPNGQQRIDDILAEVKQYFHDC